MTKKPILIPVKMTPYERDEAEEQSAKIKAQFLEQKREKMPPVKPGNVAPSLALRQRILSLSLFPNPYNHKMMLKYAPE
jgi:hypothetical protein